MGQCPKFIAELSGNHGGSIDSAYAHIDAAAAAGADFVKIQTYKPETITINSNLPDFLINDSKSLWYGRTLWDVYRAHTWMASRLIFLCSESGVTFFSSPFDPTAVELAEQCGCPIYKVYFI